MKDKKMERISQATEKKYPILSTYLEDVLNGRPFDEVLSSISLLELSPVALREQLDHGFVEAVAMQKQVLDMNLNIDDEMRVRADIVSLLAAYQGWGNQEVLVERRKKNEFISAQDYKGLQIISSLNDAEEKNDALIVEAVAGYSRAFELNVTEPQTLLDKAGAKLDVAIDRARNNAHVRGATAAAAVLIASTAVSLATAGSASAAVKSVNVNPTKPSSDNEVKSGHVVKVKTRQAQTPESTEKTTQPDAQPRIDAISADPKRTARAAEAAMEADKANEPIEEKKPIITISRKGVVTATPSEPKVADKADEKEKKKGNVIRIKPIPVVPAPKAASPETDKLPKLDDEKKSSPAVSPEVSAAQAVAKIKHDDLTVEIRDTLPKKTNWDNTGRMLEYLMIHADLTDSQAIGVVANAMWESGGVHPGQSQIGGPAFGLVQWEGGRRTALEAYAAEKNMPVDDLYVQLDFMIMELKRDGWNGYAELKQAKTSSEATLIFMRKFERPGIPHEQMRLKISKVLTDLFNERLSTSNGADEEKAAADAAKKAADEKAAADAEQTKRASQKEKTVEEFTEWKDPVPEGSARSPQYPGHKGLDFAVKAGTPFYASAGGTVKVLIYDVTSEQFCKDAFNRIGRSMDTIKDPIQKEVRITRMIGDDKYEVIYAHMSEIGVEDGEIVSAGQEIGKTGNSGCSTGDHAHFEIRKNGVAIDPNAVLNSDSWRTMSVATQSVEEDHSHVFENEEVHANESSSHQHSVNDIATIVDGSPEPAEINQISEKSVGHSLTDDQKRRLAAIKQVAELKKRMSATAELQKNAVRADEGYLSVQR